jgi:ATP/maltotriose-dependent transcriptional regulator MalT
MEKNPIFGHESARQQLADQFKNGQLAHAYLFYGPQGIGKRLVAGEFASQILKGSAVDFMELDLVTLANSILDSLQQKLVAQGETLNKDVVTQVYSKILPYSPVY